jgi:hypothetical protein
VASKIITNSKNTNIGHGGKAVDTTHTRFQGKTLANPVHECERSWIEGFWRINQNRQNLIPAEPLL